MIDPAPPVVIHGAESIRYLQVETSSICNFRCIYCPVGVEQRAPTFLPIDKIRAIAAQLGSFSNLELIYLNGYDEPTLNPQLVDIVNIFAITGIKICLLTNATNLTKELATKLARSGSEMEICVHLSGATADDFRKYHQSHQFERVTRNLEELRTFEYFDDVPIHISMYGRDCDEDRGAYERIVERYGESRFQLHFLTPHDRAGLLKNGYFGDYRHEEIYGCALQDRISSWLHITAHGNAIICCQDYHEEVRFGNIAENSLKEIVESTARRRAIEWSLSGRTAPKNFICRKCKFAITRPSDSRANQMVFEKAQVIA